MTQFEALTAAAYSELARQDVEVAVIEAGLGGRYDATNVIPSKVQVLTSVGLEHTRWLGPTLTDIARGEARGRPGRRHARARGRARSRRGARGRARWPPSAARGSSTRAPTPGSQVGAAGAFQRRNFALARAAAEAFLGELDDGRGGGGRAEVRVPGRLQEVAQRAADAAGRRPQPGRDARARGVAARDRRRPRSPGRGRLHPRRQGRRGNAGCAASRMRCHRLHHQSESAGIATTHAAIAGHPAGWPALGDRAPSRAAALAACCRELAGRGGVVIVTGSLYLIADLMSPRRGEPGSVL